MGNTRSRTEVNRTVDALFSVVNNTAQDCSSNLTQQQVDRIVNNTGSVTITDSNYEQFAAVDVQCLLTAKTQNDIQAKLIDQVKQQSEAISQQFQLSGAEATAVTNLLTQISLEITNNFASNCPAAILQEQGVDIANNAGNIVFRAIRRNQVANVLRSCSASADNVNAIKGEIQTIVDQTARAKTENFLSGLLQLLAIILILLGAFALVGFKGLNILTQPDFWLGLVLLLGVVLIVNYFLNWLPYRGVSSGDASTEAQDARRFNLYVLLAVVVVVLIDVGLIAALLYMRSVNARKTATTVAAATALARAVPAPATAAADTAAAAP
jgi:uncharacterized membrane protein